MRKPDRLHQKGILTVNTVDAFIAAPFDAEHNVILLPGEGERTLAGGFNDLAKALGTNGREELPGMWNIESRLAPFAAAFPDETARIIADARMLADANIVPSLSILPSRDNYSDAPPLPFRSARTDAPLVRSDTHLFHIDFGQYAQGRFITCYAGPATEGLAMGDSVPAASLPGVRRRMRAEFARATGEILPLDSQQLARWMATHKELRTIRMPVKGARPFSFAPGDFWLQAGESRDKGVTEPFTHRAPRTRDGMPPRLLLIGDRFG